MVSTMYLTEEEELHAELEHDLDFQEFISDHHETDIELFDYEHRNDPDPSYEEEEC